MRTLAEIDEDLKALFKERNEVLATQVRPFREVYTVFNHDLERVVDNTFVFDPLKKRDRDYLMSYAEGLPDSTLKRELLDWLSEYSQFRCVRDRICPVNESPVCCAHCTQQLNCLMSCNENLCAFVEVGDVLVVSDCIDEM